LEKSVRCASQARTGESRPYRCERFLLRSWALKIDIA